MENQLRRARFARRRVLALGAGGAAAALLAACGGGGKKEGPAVGSATGNEKVPAVARPAGWSDETHGSGAEPDFKAVFPADRVNRVEIRVTPETWEAMLANMTTLSGARGTGGGLGGGFQQGGPGGRPGGGGPGNLTPTNPDWAKATIAFNGKTWTNVGFRFKGNSSLQQGWRSGTDRLPFKLDFDQWEGDHPEIANQRFYGFKQLSLSNNFSDGSYMRETVAYDLFDEVGLVAANTASWEVLLDRGEGPKSLGIYAAIEVVDDTVLARSFKQATGNIYEADGPAATLAANVLGQIETSFEVEGGDNPDWSDVKALHAALHSELRTRDAAAWRKGLEAVFDVDTFLKWLAMAAAIQHWDTYGGLTHNYYLYNNPETKKLTWITWDHNMILGAGPGGFGPPAGAAVAGGGPQPGGQQPAGGPDPGQGGPPQGGGRGPGGLNMNVTFDKKEVGTNWPLIRFLLDQQEYNATYLRYLRSHAEKVFVPDRLLAKYAKLAEMIGPSLPAADASAFRTAVEQLGTQTRSRHEALLSFLATAGGG